MDDNKRKKIALLENWIRENFLNSRMLTESNYALAYDIVNLLDDFEITEKKITG